MRYNSYVYSWDNKVFLQYRKYLFIVAACCLAFAGHAQNTYNLRGYVCTKGTSVRVSQVLVTNKQTKAIMVTDQLGGFTIKASLGDTLEFNKPDFTTTQQVVMGPSDLVIVMQQVIHLSQVMIKGQTKQQELNEVMGDYRSKGIYYNGKPSALAAVTSPLTGLYELFGREPKQAKRFAEYTKLELEASQDHRKYNKELVKRITNLPDDEIQKFMDTFTPSHEDLQKWNDYEIITYIKNSLEIYKKTGAVPMQKLY